MIQDKDFNRIAFDFNVAHKRLIILNYEGCLVPYDAYPCDTSPNLRVNFLIHKLTNDIRNKVVVVSDFDKETLPYLVANEKLFLIAEGGEFYKEPEKEWSKAKIDFDDWVTATLLALKALAFEYEGSFVEERENSICWNYKKISRCLSKIEVGQISAAIKDLPTSSFFRVAHDDGIIELHLTGIQKSLIIVDNLCTNEYDFILAMGDGNIHEPLVNKLTDETCQIGIGKTIVANQNFQIDSQDEVLIFLKKLIDVNHEFNRVMPLLNLSLYRLN